jgi:hypothetical protein
MFHVEHPSVRAIGRETGGRQPGASVNWPNRKRHCFGFGSAHEPEAVLLI